MNADGTDPQPTSYDADVTSTSPDGRTQLLEHDGVIYAVDVASKRRTAVSQGLRAEQGTFSPDGKWIAFEQRSAADPQRVDLSVVVVARSNGEDSRVISPGTDPSWSPLGSLLVSSGAMLAAS